MSQGNSDYPDIYDPRSPVPAQTRSLSLSILPVLPSNVPLLYRVLGTGTPSFKMSAGDSAYTDASQVPGQTCGNCVRSYQHVTSGRFICDQIRPDVVLNGWCRLWRAP